MAAQEHRAHDVLVRQRLSCVLPAPDRDLDNARILTREPGVGAALGRPRRPYKMHEIAGPFSV
jgi:hypothetical protein